MTSPQTDRPPEPALTELRLPAIKALWPRFAEQADKEGWHAARLLSALVEHELAERDRRRIARHLAQARLLPGKTLDTFDFTAVPMLSKAHVSAITAGDSWIGKGSNILLFGPPGVGKSHLGSASAYPLSRKAIVCSSHEPLIWFKSYSRRGAISSLKAPLLSSINSTCSSSTTSHMSPKTRLKRAFCSKSSARDTSDDLCSSPPTNPSVNGTQTSQTRQ